MPRARLQESPSPPPPGLPPQPFREALAVWYRKHARQLPWRGIRNPYGTWLSEIMLQQTRVATVIDRYSEFLHRFPTLADLAAAPEDDVLALWSGLGYYRRARMLHRGAQFVVRELGGQLPPTATELRTLPGVGEYTAAAIASIAFGQSIAVLDGNVERVLLRLLGRPEDKSAATHTALLQVANTLVPPAPESTAQASSANPPGDHNQAMMELGATICLPRGPLCLHCPVYAFCATRGEHPTAPRARLRSRHVACLLTTRKRGTRTEVLLERRAAEATLMPGMLELPPLPLQSVASREPALRLRHSITNTNYYVEVYTEGAAGPISRPEVTSHPPFAAAPSLLVPTEPEQESPEQEPPATLPAKAPGNTASGAPRNQNASREETLGHEVFGTVFSGEAGDLGQGPSLQAEIPAAPADLIWCSTQHLYDQPLTGLTRKALGRMGLMPLRPVRVRNQGSI